MSNLFTIKKTDKLTIKKPPTNTAKNIHIALISVHGLIRSRNLELGRDADTGGQTKYVADLAIALSNLPEVKQVDLITRKIKDDSLDSDYSKVVEKINNKANIIRFECGPEEYIAKENLWDYLDTFTDNIAEYYKSNGLPDIIHSHYADAGYVATRLSDSLDIPYIHTGHSLGRDKRQRLIASGYSAHAVNTQYQMNKRIEAEEEVLVNAKKIITSTRQEIEEQYALYDNYNPDKMHVIPPGTNLSEFHPPELGDTPTTIYDDIKRFLDEPDKPMILALSRPDPRKNIATLIHAYGQNPELQEMANLVIIAGNRDDIREMEEGAESVFTEIFALIDFYDIYGKVAIPKKHRSDEVSSIYQMAAQSRGVFVNPALTEPFGLTLLEAAASGLPFIATKNGGPKDIIKNCESGLLVDPTDANAISDALTTILSDSGLWKKLSNKGLDKIPTKYGWENHAKEYLKLITPIISNDTEKNHKISYFAQQSATEKIGVFANDA